VPFNKNGKPVIPESHAVRNECQHENQSRNDERNDERNGRQNKEDMNADRKNARENLQEMMNEMKDEIKEGMNANRKHSLIYCCMLDCVYIAVAWQRIDQICYNIYTHIL
jgi:Flp pilus assembly protein TadB